MVGIGLIPCACGSTKRRRWARSIATVFLLVAAVGGGRAQAPAVEPVPLPEEVFPGLRTLIEQAVAQSPAMLEANLSVARAGAGHTVARAGLLPRLGASGSYQISEVSRDDASGADNRSDGLFYNVNFNQPLFHWGALRAQNAIARLDVLLSKQNMAEAYRVLVGSLREQFLGAVLQKMALRNQEFDLQIYRRNLSALEERVAQGTAGSAELVAPRMALQEAEIRLERAQAALERSLRLAAQLAGVKEIALDDLPGEVPTFPRFNKDEAGPVWAYATGTLEASPVAQGYLTRIRQDELRYRIARTRLLPKLDLTAGYGVMNITDVGGANITQTAATTISYGVGINWALFDGLASRGEKRQALLARRLNERALQTHLERTRIQLDALRKEIELSARQMALAEQRLDMARGSYGIVQEDIALGITPPNAADGARQGVNNAELQAAQARFDYLSRWSEYLSTAGADPAMDLVPVRYLDHGR